MRKSIAKKALTILLSVLMVMTMMPAMAFAAETDPAEPAVNHAPVLIEGVTDTEAQVQANDAYLLKALQAGKIFSDPDGDTLTTKDSYFYQRRVFDEEIGEYGEWGVEEGFADALFGLTTISITEKKVGKYQYRFYAKDDKNASSADDGVYWTLTLNVVKKGLWNTKFYVSQDQNFKTNGGVYPIIKLWASDGDSNKVGDQIQFTDSLYGETSEETAAESNTVVDNYNMFYATLEAGWYVYEAYGYAGDTNENGVKDPEEYNVSLGGMQIKIPADENVDGNVSGGTDIYLRLAPQYTNSKKVDGTYFGEEDYTASLSCPIMQCEPKPGTPYKSGNYTYYPFMVYAGGNSCLYNRYVYPTDTDTYMFNQGINATFKAGYTANAASALTINSSIILTVKAPDSADFGLYFQWNNFNTKEVKPDSKTTEDGQNVYKYKISKGNANYTWRLTDKTGAYVTKAGWLPSKSESSVMEVAFDENSYTDKTSHDFSHLGTTTANRDEGDLQVNLDPTGFKSFTGTRRVRAYRWWELINSDTANIMVEPDFHWNVLNGGPATITYAEDDASDIDGGNSYHNWADINANGGTSIIATYYDAIDMDTSNNTTHAGFYPATNPDRVSVNVVTDNAAGTADAHIKYNNNGSTQTRSEEWDYAYDTWYYMRGDENAALDFTASGAETVEYATVTTSSSMQSTLSSFTALTADEEGNYKAPLTGFDNSANNYGGTLIIKMTDASGNESYRNVRISGMAANIENADAPGEDLRPGDSAVITFDGLYRSVNKQSGIFNPTTFYLRYTAGETEYNGTLGQYQKMNNSSIKLTVPKNIEFEENKNETMINVSNGYVFGSMYSAANPFSTLYEMTDTGVGTNFNAVTVSWCMQHLADINIKVIKPAICETTLNITDGEKAVEGCNVVLKDNKGNEVAGDNNVYALQYGKYSYAVSKEGYYDERGKFEINEANGEKTTVDILMRTPDADAWDGLSKAEPPKAGDEYYEISTAAQLAWFAEQVNNGEGASYNARLMNDISLGAKQWTPIGSSNTKPFKGTFDGDGHYVTELYVNGTAAYQGFFGYGNACKIYNLGVKGYVSGAKTYTAGLIGYAVGASVVENCINYCDVEATGNAVTANGNIAGIGSFAATAKVNNCINMGDITGSGKYVGGVSGSNLAVVMKNCYNTGNITTTSTTLTNTSSLGNCNATNCYFVDRTTNGTGVKGTAVTADELKNKTADLGDAFRNDCIGCNSGYPVLVWMHDRAVEREIIPATDATCEKAGNTEGSICSVCKEAIVATEEIPALGHDYAETAAKVEPTCTEAGKEAVSECSRCHDVKGGETIEALGHDYAETAAKVEPTCTEAGKEAVSECSRCHEVIGGETIEALGHDYAETAAKVEPTCTEAGKEAVLECSRCHDLQGGETIEALGHEEVADESAEATCTETGLTEGKHCDRCKEVLIAQGVIPALGHDYVEIEAKVEPTCTEAGKEAVSECSRCHDVKGGEELAALGHKEDVIVAVEPTCTEDGKSAETFCSVCKKVLAKSEIIPALGHDYVETVAKVEPTCTEAGKEAVSECSRCHDVKGEDVIAALGHKEVMDKAVEPTCTEAGKTEGSHCEVCGEVLKAQEEIKAAGHKAVTDKAVEATCTKAGLSEGSHCEVCGEVLNAQSEIPAFGHNYKVTKEAKKVTCTEAGNKEEKTCEICGKITGGEIVEALGHDYEETEAKVKATCTEAGKEAILECSRCHDVIGGETIKALGHNKKTVITKATTKAAGKIVVKCSRCEEILSTKKINKIDTVKLAFKSTVYNAKVRKPAVTVTDSKGNKLTSDSYSVTYAEGRKKVGKYEVTITFKGNYKGTVTRYFKIVPKKTTVESLTAIKGGFKLKYKKQAVQTTGYQIRYSTSSKMTNSKKVKTTKNTTLTKTVKNLKSGKKYYVQVRTYKKVNNTYFYSTWTKKKAVTTK